MKRALLVVDVQHGIFNSENKPFNSANTLKNIASLIHAFSAEHDLVIFVQHEAPSIVEFGSSNWQIAEELPHSENDVKIRKRTPDSFFNTELEACLSKNQIKHIYISGYATDFCIDRTTFSAAMRGYNVTLVSDAHTTHSKHQLDAASIISHHNFILSKHPQVELHSTQDVLSARDLAS